MRFCALRRVSPFDVSAGPNNVDLLAHFVLWRLNGAVLFRSLLASLPAIDRYLQNAGGTKLPREDFRFMSFMAGVQRMYEGLQPRNPARPFTIRELSRLCRSLVARGTTRCYMLRALVLLSYWALLRTGEAYRLRIGEVRECRVEPNETDNCQATGPVLGLSLVVHSAKAQHFAQTTFVVARGDALCPVRAWFEYRNAERGASQRSGFALRRPRHVWQLSEPSLNSELRVALGLADMPITGYSWYSCRRGGVTTLLESGVPHVMVQRQGRWRDPRSLLHYFDSDGVAGQHASVAAAFRTLPDFQHPMLDDTLAVLQGFTA